MSYRPTYYGGFPGPPENQQFSQTRNQEFNGAYHLPQAFVRQDVTYFTNSPNAGFLPVAPDQVTYNGAQLIPPSFYHSPHVPFYLNHPQDSPANAVLSSGSSLHPALSENPPSLPNETAPDNRIDPPQSIRDNEPRVADNGGKSRRFSRQRNVRDGGTSGEFFSGMNQNECDEKAGKRKEMNKHPIRFSHQREKTKEKNDGNKSPSKFDVRSAKPKKEKNAAKPGDKVPITSRSSLPLATSNKGGSRKERPPNKPLPADKRNQTSVLLDQLSTGAYECMVCCDRVRPQHAVWNCTKCYNLFHMGCIKKWARSPAAKIENSGWRCPGCQNITKSMPTSYYCFCGKVRDPQYTRGETAHSCGDVCGKERNDNTGCTHPCNILCHPGPCPQCPAMINKPCRCGKLRSYIRCSQQKDFVCDSPCEKLLNCRRHTCKQICHAGQCDDCEVTLEEECYCGEDSRKVVCGSEAAVGGEKYSCGNVCKKNLSCGNHFCEETCHPGECKRCHLLPSVVLLCPCTQTKLAEMVTETGAPVCRESCTDPVPTCRKVCGKPLKCGGDEIHICKLECHPGECPPCPDQESTVICRCGKSDKDVPCKQYYSQVDYVCDRRCNKKRKCGRHKCGKVCCVDSEHACSQICGKRLTCGKHRCDDLCHRGNCHVCYDVSFDELRCFCGEQVIYPPIPCGSKPPECANECARMHACSHPVRHTCHTDEKCPPCIELVKKPCNCGRVVRGNIMCHVDNVSCGTECSKVLPCGHKCPKPCHRGPCSDVDDVCRQPCSIMRVECIHPCATPCHPGVQCPSAPCKAMVTLKCPCGRREDRVECSAGGALVLSINSAMSSKDEVHIGSLIQPGTSHLRTLHCDEECRVYARNKRLAEALNIKTDDFSSQSKQRYSDFLIAAAKNDGGFIRAIEKDLKNLVESVQWMALPRQTHSFPPMKKEKRQSEGFHSTEVSMNTRTTLTGCLGAAGLWCHPRHVNLLHLVVKEKSTSKLPDPLLSDVVIEHVAMERVTSPKPAKKGLLKSMRLVSYRSSQENEKRQPPPFRQSPTSSHRNRAPGVIGAKMEALRLAPTAGDLKNPDPPHEVPPPPVAPKEQNIDYFDMTE